MENAQKQSEITKYAADLIRHKAHQLVGKAGFTRDDVEDIQQDLIVDLLERLPNFDPNKAAYNTFVARIVKRKVCKLIRHRMQGMRDYRREDYSINTTIKIDDETKIECSQTISRDEQDFRTGKHLRPADERTDLRLDISLVVSGLPPELRELAGLLLTTTSIAEVARKLGIPRSTLYDKEILRLRNILKDKGLDGYL